MYVEPCIKFIKIVRERSWILRFLKFTGKINIFSSNRWFFFRQYIAIYTSLLYKFNDFMDCQTSKTKNCCTNAAVTWYNIVTENQLKFQKILLNNILFFLLDIDESFIKVLYLTIPTFKDFLFRPVLEMIKNNIQISNIILINILLNKKKKNLK